MSSSCSNESRVTKKPIFNHRRSGFWNAYVQPNGGKEFCESIKDKVKIQQPRHREAYGQIEFEVEDPNGYIPVFSEPVPS
jgi:hypothetical protein